MDPAARQRCAAKRRRHRRRLVLAVLVSRQPLPCLRRQRRAVEARRRREHDRTALQSSGPGRDRAFRHRRVERRRDRVFDRAVGSLSGARDRRARGAADGPRQGAPRQLSQLAAAAARRPAAAVRPHRRRENDRALCRQRDRARAHRRAGDSVARGVCRRSPAVDDGGPSRRAALRRCRAEAFGNAGHARAGGVPGRRAHAGLLGLGRRHARLCRRRQRIAPPVPLDEPHRHLARRGWRRRKLRLVRPVAGWRPGGRRGPPGRLAAAFDAGADRHDAGGDERAHHRRAFGHRSEIRPRRGRRVCAQQRRGARRSPRARSRRRSRPSRIRAAARR